MKHTQDGELRQDLIRPLSDYVGIHFSDHGGDRIAGLDCWGLVRLWYREQLNIELLTYSSYYSWVEDSVGISAAFEEETQHWNLITTPKIHDVVIFKIAKVFRHVGVMIDSCRFLHILGEAGVTLESLDSYRWVGRGRRFYRQLS